MGNLIGRKTTVIEDTYTPKCCKCGRLLEDSSADTSFEYYELSSCSHLICTDCFKEHAEIEYGVKQLVDCPKCGRIVHEEEIEILLSEEWEEMVEELEDEKTEINEGFVRCRCGEEVEVKNKKVNYNLKDEEGYPVSKEASECYAKYRTKCNQCNDELCGKCMLTPFHLGFTCSQYREYIESEKCRYCGYPVKKKRKKGILQFVCSKFECKNIAKHSCSEILDCGHVCRGVRKEEECLPCLEADCVERNEKATLSENTMSNCTICFTDPLGQLPCVQLECKHIFHAECLEKKVEMKWAGPRIHFSYKKCPACKADISWCSHKRIDRMIQEANELEEKVRVKAIERGKAEGIDKDERLRDEQNEFFGRYEEYCLDRLAYYICHNCNDVYYGGMRECGNAIENQDDYDPTDYICGECKLENYAGKANCDIHGDQFIEWKCRYCCNYSRWFCFGTTHFCNRCHSHLKKTIYKCPGPPQCQIKMEHPSDGKEFAMGCGMCKNQRVENM
ncbi:unnamed protein product [Moneuplotes crassus]|uniref:RING-type domain-containing protein n=1 Tax=Euplotes crassus TaxID=5936 RepID=A0AAD1UFE1_EUPCR|nr:unnamed protein product [Moneuplotes crassus]